VSGAPVADRACADTGPNIPRLFGATARDLHDAPPPPASPPRPRHHHRPRLPCPAHHGLNHRPGRWPRQTRILGNGGWTARCRREAISAAERRLGRVFVDLERLARLVAARPLAKAPQREPATQERPRARRQRSPAAGRDDAREAVEAIPGAGA
jgi:hypothetical protein